MWIVAFPPLSVANADRMLFQKSFSRRGDSAEHCHWSLETTASVGLYSDVATGFWLLLGEKLNNWETKRNNRRNWLEREMESDAVVYWNESEWPIKHFHRQWQWKVQLEGKTSSSPRKLKAALELVVMVAVEKKSLEQLFLIQHSLLRGKIENCFCKR